MNKYTVKLVSVTVSLFFLVEYTICFENYVNTFDFNKKKNRLYFLQTLAQHLLKHNSLNELMRLFVHKILTHFI